MQAGRALGIGAPDKEMSTAVDGGSLREAKLMGEVGIVAQAPTTEIDGARTGVLEFDDTDTPVDMTGTNVPITSVDEETFFTNLDGLDIKREDAYTFYANLVDTVYNKVEYRGMPSR